MKTLIASLALLPPAMDAFMVPRSVFNIRRQQPSLSRLYQQQPYYNEADGQYYYYNSSDGNYYTETGQMWIGEEQQPSYDQQGYEQQAYNQQQQDYEQTYDEQEEGPSLILTNIQSEMSAITAEAGMDYLSLARQRAAEKRESVNNISTDSDWLNLAEEVKRKKEEEGEQDAWDASLEDEGSEGDAAALGMGTVVTEGGLVLEGDNGDEPKLLL